MSASDDIKPPAPEFKKLPRVTCVLCGITQAKPAMDGERCRNDVACQLRRDRNARRKEAKGK
jgi:hypothetical protein